MPIGEEIIGRLPSAAGGAAGRKLGLKAAGEARRLSEVGWSEYVCPEAHWES